MSDVESSDLKRYFTQEITENSANLLKGAASNLEIWARWLDAIAQHPNESANNCAAIMASSYEDTRELRSAREWDELEGTVKPGERGIPLVHRSKSGNYYVDVLYPASAVEGARDHYRGLPVKIDLEDEVNGPAFLAATEKWGAMLFDASPNVGYVVYSRYGLAGGPDPVLPDPEIVGDAKALANYCRDLKRDAENLVFKFDRTIEAARRNIMSPRIEQPKQDAEAKRKDLGEGQERGLSSDVVERESAPKVEFDAASYMGDPASIYSAASTAAKIASGDDAGQIPDNHI